MKKQLLLIVSIIAILGIASCKKDDNNAATTPTTSSQLFISFSLDGTATNITNTTYQINTGYGGGSYTSSSFFDLSTTGITDITLAMNQDTILGSDFQSLIGQQLPILDCLGCGTNMYLSYDINGNTYRTYDTNNPFPANYFRITAVALYNNVIEFGQSLNQYYVTGEFVGKLSYGSDIKNVTNGKFRMIFREVKN